MVHEEREPQSGRETRLLALIIAVALALLYVLARFRFPEAEMTGVVPPPTPLEALAGSRGPFDELSAVVGRLAGEAEAAFTVIEIEAPGARRSGPPTRRLVPALRVRSDAALLRLAPGEQPAAPAAGVSAPAVLATDERLGLALVRLPPLAGWTRPTAHRDFAGFAYVAAVEAAMGAPSLRPVFVGRVDAVADDRWALAALAPGGTFDVPDGAFVITLEGRLIGLVVRGETGAVLVPALALDAVVAGFVAGTGPAP